MKSVFYGLPPESEFIEIPRDVALESDAQIDGDTLRS
jgi:hypothetical protein